MSLSYGAAGTVSTGTGLAVSLTPGTPASSGTGYRNFLCVLWKPSSTSAEPTVTATGGVWKHSVTKANTTGVVSGADTGSMRLSVWYVDGTTPTGTTVVITGTVGAAQAIIFNVLNSDAATVTGHNFDTAEDNAVGANYSATTTAEAIAATTADLIVAVTATNTDAGTVSARTFTSSGLTFASLTNPVDNASATGDDSWVGVSYAAVTAGSQVATLAYTHTNASPSEGVTIFLGIRALPLPTFTVSRKSDFYQNPAYQLTVTGTDHYAFFEVKRDDQTGLPGDSVRYLQYQEGIRSSYTIPDYEFRFGATGWLMAKNNITYTAKFYYGGEVVTQAIAVAGNPLEDYAATIDATFSGTIADAVFAKSFLSCPDTASLNIPVVISDFQGYSTKGNVLTSSHVLGRRNPVVAVDVAEGFTGKFTLLVANQLFNSSYGAPTNVEHYTSLLSLGESFLMRNVSPLIAGIDDFYFIVTDFQVKRENIFAPQQTMVDLARSNPIGLLDIAYQPVITIEVTFQRVDAPPYISIIPAFTWQTLADHFDTWQEVADHFPDWNAVAKTTDGIF